MSHKICHGKWPVPPKDDTVNVLNNEFFDDLWPLILKQNICEVPFHDEKNFQPQHNFNEWLCHSTLAQNCYKDYNLPLLVQWRHQYPPVASKCSETMIKQEDLQPTHMEDIDVMLSVDLDKYCKEIVIETSGLCPEEADRGRPQGLSLIDRQKKMEDKKTRSRRLAREFANRKHPWYKERPAYEKVFGMTASETHSFNSDADFNMLHNVYHFNCRLIILNMSACMGMQLLQSWIKFTNHAGVLVVAHCPVFFRRLWALRDVFVPCFVQENFENTWQEELQTSLEKGLAAAKAAGLYKDCGQSFIFIFSEDRYSKTWETFRIMRGRKEP